MLLGYRLLCEWYAEKVIVSIMGHMAKQQTHNKPDCEQNTNQLENTPNILKISKISTHTAKQSEAKTSKFWTPCGSKCFFME